MFVAVGVSPRNPFAKTTKPRRGEMCFDLFHISPLRGSENLHTPTVGLHTRLQTLRSYGAEFIEIKKIGWQINHIKKGVATTPFLSEPLTGLEPVTC